MSISIKHWLPFFLILGGVFLDYTTTTIGLNMGFHEANPQYHPIWALLVFSAATVLIKLSIPQRKRWLLILNIPALATYLGVVNNTLVILGLFPGL